MKPREEIILAAFDLTGSFRDAGELAGVTHHTLPVASFYAIRAVCVTPDVPRQRSFVTDEPGLRGGRRFGGESAVDGDTQPVVLDQHASG